MSIQIYGSPSDTLLEEMRKLAGTGVPVSIKERRVGFSLRGIQAARMAMLRSSQCTSHNRHTAGASHGASCRSWRCPSSSSRAPGAVDGLKRSAALLEQTWGEIVLFKLGFGVLGIAPTAPVIVVLPIAQAAGASV
jgi:hypothetical protein